MAKVSRPMIPTDWLPVLLFGQEAGWRPITVLTPASCCSHRKEPDQPMVQRGIHSQSALASLIKSKWTERTVYLVLVPALLLYSLWLPPAQLGVRLFHTHYPVITPDEGGVVSGPQGARLDVPARAVGRRVRIAMGVVTDGRPSEAGTVAPRFFVASVGGRELGGLKLGADETDALDHVPDDAAVCGPIYRFDLRGETPSRAFLTLPVPDDLVSIETADLYGWDGKAWRWLPSHASSDAMTIRAELESVPSLLIVGQAQPTLPRIGFGASATGAGLDDSDLSVHTVTMGGLTLTGEGEIVGEIPPADELAGAAEGARLLLTLSNLVDNVVRSDLVDNLIISEELRVAHIRSILQVVTSGGYGGVEIVYGGVSADLRPEFTSFMAELGQALGEAGKLLAVRVDAPVSSSASWHTGAYDWNALGQVADLLRIPAMSDPAAYAPGSDMDRLLSWATGEVNRKKIELSLSTRSHVLEDGDDRSVSYTQALNLLARNIAGDLRPDAMLLPGEAINIDVPSLGDDALQLDQDAQVYCFTYCDADTATVRTVWLESASSIARKLQYVIRYGLGGVSLDDALDPENDPRIRQVIQTFQESVAPPEPHFAFVWSVEDASGNTIRQEVAPVTDPRWSWTAPSDPGHYVIRAAVSDDGGETNLGSVSELAVQVPSPTPTLTPTPTSTPTPTPTQTNTPTPTSTPTPEPRPKVVASGGGSARVGGYFGYGIQADMITDGNHDNIFHHVKTMGFGWIKQQVEWFRYNPGPGQYNWGPLDRIVDGANANGINVLFSVVKAPKWARPPGDTDEGPPADPNTYGDFMRAMATRYKGRVKAYEIWNEQNLYYEWGGRGQKLNAAKYVELLKVAYNAIKSVDPGAVVVSGALTPTGYNDGDTAIDDRVYLEQMYQAGMARYCDAVGAHPSGYNMPPDADWRSYEDPTAGFRGPFDNRHPSWCFRATMESYRNIMLKYGDGGKRIWATEFGWATVEGLGVPPVAGYEYAADNTQAEQAQFLVRAYQMGKGWGWVGPMFLWNLNFGPVAGAADEKAAFGIVNPGWGPRPAFAALRDMAK